MNKIVIGGLVAPLLLSLTGCIEPDYELNTTRGAFVLGATAEAVKNTCDQGETELKRMVEAFRKLPSTTPADVINAKWNAIYHKQSGLAGSADLQANTDPNEALRNAAQECADRISLLSSSLYLDRGLYERFVNVPARSLSTLDSVNQNAREAVLREFRAAGANLADDSRARLTEIEERLTKLSSEFQQNVNKDGAKEVVLSEAEVKGIDPGFLAGISKDAAGYHFKLNYPSRDNIMGYADSETAREKFYRAFMLRGGQRNLDILDELSELRREKAKLKGFVSFAAMTLADNRMAGTPEAVDTFLKDVGDKVTPLEQKEIDELAALKRQHTGQTDARLQRWDQTYYQTMLKKQKYAIDQNEVRKQFPTQASVDWLLLVSSRLYGVSFKPNTAIKTWDKDVKIYDVFENDAKKTYIGTFYMDLFPREGKYGHAAAWGVRDVTTEMKMTPVSVLVTNFDRNGLSQDELETMFHEFGHVLHGVLSKTRYSWNAGTNVARDFVEAPSQMYEEWARRPESIKLFNEACSSCKPVDMALVDKMKKANNYGAGLQYSRQKLYAAFDMSLVGPTPVKSMDSWKAMEGATPLGYVEGTMFPAAFGHLAGGYAAGYYGYMWSEVLALDMLSPYGNNVMDTKVGKRYRDTILARGGEVPAMDLVTQFLGRKPNSDAFFAQITGQR